MNEPLYLDFNASTPLLPEVLEATTAALKEFGNPSSGHVYGRRSKALVDEARGRVAELIGCDPDELLFTSGGTESNNLALAGLAASSIVTSVIEHPSVSGPIGVLERRGVPVQRWPVDARGVVQIGPIPPKALVSVMHSNNETGVLQPIADLARRATAVGALTHTDASQSVGKVEVSVRELGVDALTVCGHKLYAPKGVGALFLRRGLTLAPFLTGASHERGLRPGTENVGLIAGLGVAAMIAKRSLGVEASRVAALRDRLETMLRSAVPGLAVNGEGAPRLPNTSSVRFPGVGGTALLSATPELAASTGSACHEGHESASAIILAMGVEPSSAAGTVRLSLGRSTTEADVELAARLLGAAWRRLTHG